MNVQFTVPLTPVVKGLIIINVVVWFCFQILLESLGKLPFTQYFHLIPLEAIFQFKVWQLFTYMFVHAQDGITHILFNMLMLWFFGSELEGRWGKKAFLSFYLSCGVGAGFLYCFGLSAYAAITGSQSELYIPVVGASGALFAVLLAYGWFFGDRVMYFFMLFPMKARYFVALMAFIQFASMMSASRKGSEVAYLAHLGGLVMGVLYLWTWNRMQRFKWNQMARRKSRNLRLVVDNEKPTDSAGPKYWN